MHWYTTILSHDKSPEAKTSGLIFLKEQFIKHVSIPKKNVQLICKRHRILRKAAVRHNNAYHTMIKIASAINFLHSAHPNWISIIFALKCPAHSILFCKYVNAIISCCWCQFYILVSFSPLKSAYTILQIPIHPELADICGISGAEKIQL